ncbi:hypothetical protein [Yersinia pestis]
MPLTQIEATSAAASRYRPNLPKIIGLQQNSKRKHPDELTLVSDSGK